MANNPWIEGHIAAETHFQDGDRGLAAAIVRNEYAGADPPVECPQDNCDGTAWYKATIGAHKCTTCGGLCDSNGDPY